MKNKILILISIIFVLTFFSNCGRKSEPLKPSQINKMN